MLWWRLTLALLCLVTACGTTTGGTEGGAEARSGAVGASPTSPAASKPTRSVAPTAAVAWAGADVDRERYLEATWAPGQLEAHFEKHGREGPYRTAAEYDGAVRETIRRGVYFTYVDRDTDAARVGFYERPTNRFTGLTRDGRRITTHFRPDRGEAYVRGLERSTYR